MRPIFIVGAGGLGSEVAWTLERLNSSGGKWQILGFADSAPHLQSGTFAGYPLLGTVDDAARRYPQAAAFIAIGNNDIRAKVKSELAGREMPFLVDPSAIVAPSAKIGEGTFVAVNAVLSVNAHIGRFAIINARAGVGHDCQVGDFAQISPGASLSGGTHVGAYALVGTNACTVPGVKIGARAQIAAGLGVYCNVKDGSTLSPFGSFKSRPV